MMTLKKQEQTYYGKNPLRQDFNNRVDSMYTNYIKARYIEITPLTPTQQIERVLDPSVIFVGSIWIYPGESEDNIFLTWNGTQFEELKEVPECYQKNSVYLKEH